MSKIDVIRAWKDPEYRNNLSETELGALPAHPAGRMELTDDELDSAAGGATTVKVWNCDTCFHCDNTVSWSNSCETVL